MLKRMISQERLYKIEKELSVDDTRVVMTLAVKDIFTPERAALAPLAGVTDSVFRRICVGFGACPVMTEMVSSEGYIRAKPSDKTSQFLKFSESERPIGFQFFGADPVVMAEAAQKAQDLKPDFIDINAGCPVKKVVSKGGGSALLRNPRLLAQIVEKVAGVSKIPVTVKIRSGWDAESINVIEVARRCADSGAQAVIIHPRTKSQGFSGVSNWPLIRSVRENITVPVVGSGDIKTPDDALRMKKETGVNYVMVGRSAMGNPWIFREITEHLTGKTVSKSPDIVEKLELLLKQLDQLGEEKTERFAVFKMRKFFGWYSKGTGGGAAFRQKLFNAETIEDVKKIVLDFQTELRKKNTFDKSYVGMVIS